MPRKMSDQKLWRSKAVFTLLIPIVLYPNILLNKLQIEIFIFFLPELVPPKLTFDHQKFNGWNLGDVFEFFIGVSQKNADGRVVDSP